MTGLPAVLLVNDLPVFGGVGRVVQCLWKWLPRAGVPTRVLLPFDDGAATKRFVDEWFGHDPTRVLVGPPRGRAGRLAAARLARGCPERVVNLHFNAVEGTSAAAVVGARLAGKRVVLTYHHLDERPALGRARRAALGAALRLASDVVVSTPLLADRVRALAPRARVRLVPLGVEPPARAYDRAALRARLGVPPGAFVVGHVSRLERGKGLGRVARALRTLVDAGRPDVFLLACGSDAGDAAALSDELARALPGRARLLGFVPDHGEALACCDAFAVPSGWEGFGLVYVEAALHGLPRVGTRLGGVPFVIDDGSDGFLIPPGDDAALADRLARLHDDRALARAMGERARARALREFTAERMARRYVELLRAA